MPFVGGGVPGLENSLLSDNTGDDVDGSGICRRSLLSDLYHAPDKPGYLNEGSRCPVSVISIS